MKILIVDDEKDLVDLMVYNLEKEGFQTLRAYDGETALKLAENKKPDLMVLDLMLPGMQGMEVCKKIRRNPQTATLPIIMLTAKGEEIDKILGLELGADDYVTKPFSVKEILARIKAVLRRMESSRIIEKDELFEFKELRIDFKSYQVFLGNKKLELSPMEFRLLKFLSCHPGRVYTRDQILDAVWGDESFVEPRTVDVHVRRLRAQIEKNAEKPQYIFTVRGIGYKFAER